MERSKKYHLKEQIEIFWTCDADERREDTQENATHKNGGKTTKRRTQNQIYRLN